MIGLSEVAIANMALGHCGISSVIESLDDLNPEAKRCKLWYMPSRLVCLEAFDWNFARGRIALTDHSDDPPEGQWAYRYQYPAVAAFCRRLENPLGPREKPVPFEVEASADGATRTVLTDLEQAIMVFTRDVSDTALFSLHFVFTLSHLLASNIAFPLTGKRELANTELQIYNQMIILAPAVSANEQMEREPRDAPWISGRN